MEDVNQISDDGSRMFFSSDGGLSIREEGVTTQLAPSSSFSKFFTATPDGEFAFWRDANGNLLRQEVDTGDTTILSVDNEPDDGTNPGVDEVVGVSDDGSRAYFTAGRLIDGMPS